MGSTDHRDGSQELGQRPIFVGSCCDQCGVAQWPEAQSCPMCGCDRLSPQPMPRVGQVYTYTTIANRDPTLAPLLMGYVDLQNGVRVFAEFDVSGGLPVIDQKVKLVDMRTEPTGRAMLVFGRCEAVS